MKSQIPNSPAERQPLVDGNKGLTQLLLAPVRERTLELISPDRLGEVFASDYEERFVAPAFERAKLDGKFFSRGGKPLHVRGVTYGPFAPDAAGDQFSSHERVCEDFGRMKRLGVNAVRVYHVPPAWFLDIADAQEMHVLMDVPWPKHLCFLDSREAQEHARNAVRQAAERGRDHACVLGYSIANEIPPDIVRWHGAGRVERFLSELADIARQSDPDGLITYANFPSTEYLSLEFQDFATFNVYLHDPAAFRRYLLRLQHLAGDKPLLLGEIGMDTMRHGEESQAAFLKGHLREGALAGLAGAFVFAWTDDWFTGGYQIEDWAFGIINAQRSPKASARAVGELFHRRSCALLRETPRVSVVVCSYNGGRTLPQCLRSLMALDYPDYEVILVDDGSTDDTREIASEFPEVHAIHQANQGLSVARNVGLQAATGEIVAYTDSDCFAHPDWLSLLVHQLEESGAAAVGGPNLSPDDGWLAACVGAAPGQPMHVLENDQTAEHIPGCNMAFRREALLSINGFNPRYRKAGDDVDVCWRLQDAGLQITFAPGAFVWHHRRQTPRAYLRQQSGYGEAEALLWFEHPDRFNRLGESKWRGVLYGAGLRGLSFGKPIIYRGTFASGLFQTIYQPGPAHWAVLPNTLEWHLAALVLGLTMSFWPPVWMAVLGMLGLSVAFAGLQAGQAPLAPSYRGLKSRLLIAWLCYVQPLARSWCRYRTRFFPPGNSHCVADIEKFPVPAHRRLPLRRALVTEYWDEAWRERTELLDRLTAYCIQHGWTFQVDSGWTRWDIEIHCPVGSVLRICTVQEDHGSGKRLFRLRYSLHPSAHTKAFGALGVFASAVALSAHSLSAVALAALFVVLCLTMWQRSMAVATRASAIVDRLACDMGLIRCDAANPQSNRETSL